MAKRELVVVLQIEHGLSERRACAAVGLDRSVYHYQPQPNADGPIVKLLLELGWQRPEQGFGKLFRRLRRPRPWLEPQTGPSHLLQPKAEQETERQKTFADKMSRSSGGA